MITRLPRGFTHPTLIGGGAFGTVVRARQTALDRWVAIKLIRGGSQQARLAILKEARMQARMHIDCIPQIYDAFEWRKQVCIVMEWIKGVCLNDIKKPISLEQKGWLAQGIINALAQLHQAGFAHRDLKPANILLSPQRGVFLIDFGLSKPAVDSERSTEGYAKGTPAYMAPEVMTSGQEIDFIRADIYSAGVILSKIFPDKPHNHCVALCLERNPDLRIPSGSALQHHWQAIGNMEYGAPQWQVLVGHETAQKLSRQLFEAVTLLLQSGRDDEAYWLLVESIEHDPEFEEAISLLNTFPAQVKLQQRQRRIHWALGVAAVTVITLGAAAYRFNDIRRTAAETSGGETLHPAKNQNLPFSRNTASQPVQMLEIASATTHLVGFVEVLNQPAQGLLLVDNKPIDSATTGATGFTLPFGEHRFEWRNSTGVTIWREQVAVLPFIVKRIHVWLSPPG
jgi:predicted Ser/Thr protein kinase